MTTANQQFQGVYGPYVIDDTDRREVQNYRFALLVSGLSLLSGVLHWWLVGAQWAGIWAIPFAAGIGLALRWIHIYLKPLHQLLQLFWLLGCMGWITLIAREGLLTSLPAINEQPLWLLAIGPLFAALAGIGFKEFFCFQRPEAIGLTLLLPIALLGRLLGLMPGTPCLSLIGCSAALLVLLACRKFGVDAAADVGDKSVFAYLKQSKQDGFAAQQNSIASETRGQDGNQRRI